MIYKWTLLLSFCVLLTNTKGSFNWMESDFKMFIKENIEEFKTKLHQILEKNVNYSLLKKRQSSKTESYLGNCVDLLEGHLANKQRKINLIASEMKKVWMSTNTVRISSLEVNGKVTSRKWSHIGQFDIKINMSSPAYLDKMAKRIQNRLKMVQKDFSKTISKSHSQEIKNKIILKNVNMVTATIGALNNHVTVNEMPTSRLNSILRKRGNQMIRNKVNITNLSCEKATVGLLNRNKMEDFIRLNPDRLTLSGSFEFQNVSARTVSVNGTINGQKIDNFVLTTKDQDILGQKDFKRLWTNNIATDVVGEIHLDDLKKVKVDSVNFPSVLDFSSSLIIQGNLNLSSLNGNDVMELFLNSVNTNRKQNITGKKSFKFTVIDGNIALTGRINNCNLDQFMTVNTNQTIYADVEFLKNTTFQSILTNSSNGIDLSRQAVIRSRSNVIRGIKTFTENLEVSKISLKEGVFIDSFDPSAENFQIIKTNDVDARNTHWLDGMTIENINATNVEIDVKYFPELKNLDNVWLRTTEQKIPLIEAKNLRVSELKVLRVNNITIEDLVTVKGSSTFQAPLHFTEEVFMKTVKLGEKSNLNFSPEYWNRGKVKISNNITIENAVLKRNLTIDGSVRNLELSFMHTKENQTIHGDVQFEKVKVKNLSLKDLNLNRINNINVTDFFNNAVVVPIGNRSIYNKHFKDLNGPAMLTNGVLNNVSLEKVVLKNSMQNITSPWMFMKAPFFKRIHVKNFFDGIRLENIIYTNEHGVITNKQFNGNITTTYLQVSGYISGVNVSSLQVEAFNKSERNSLKRKFTFHGNVTANEIQITVNKIDNINLEDVIRLNASADIKILNASNIIVQNVSVAGLINGCDIKSVVENAFRKQDSKNITASTIAKSLVIEGNLKITYLMGEKLSDWISSLEITSSPEIERNLEFENLNADNINFLEALNNITVDFLINDVVKRNKDQIIFKEKAFQELSAQTSFVKKLTSYKTCGINITEMFESCINKTENRTLTLLSPSIKSLVARQVSIIGTLNDLKLPTDVVLLNISETIESEVVINTTANASMGLVIYGKINGIDFKKFTEKRVTTNTTQEIFSTLDFTEDIVLQGNTGLNGTINNIRLENALKNLPNQTVAGNKHFNGTLEILADVTVNGSIRGVYLEQFLQRSRNESMKEVQFSKLNVSELICNTINEVNITDLYNHTHDVVHDVNEKLDNLTFDMLLLQDSLRMREDALDNPLSLFAFFELREIIKFGPVLKLLPVYEYGRIGEKYELQVTQMVMWINEKVNGCKKVTSVIADVSMNGTLNVTKRIRGKVFPFSLQVERDAVVGFHVQAKYSRKCSPQIRNLMIKAIIDNNNSSYDNNGINNSKISMPEGASLVDVQLLDLHEVFLVVALNMKDPGERISIYHYNASDNSWSQHQQFHLQNLTSLEFILVETDVVSLYAPADVYLSVTGDGKNSGVTVYEWDFDLEKFYLKTKMSTTASTHACWLYAHRNLYLLLAKEMIEIKRNRTEVAVFSEPLEVYTLDEDELILHHTVNIKGIRFIEPFILAGETFILATSSHMEVVYVLQFRGYNGFEVILEIPAAGITEARVFSVDNNLYLALNSRTVQSKILKAAIRGGR